MHEWLRANPSGLLVLALLVGAGAGAGAVAFRYLIVGFTYLFSGHRDYGAVGRAPLGYFHGIGFWFVVAAPVAGGLIYGPLIDRFAREARGHGVPEVMLAVAERGGRIRPQVAVVKSLASAICIGSGGSVGREGPIVQIGSALGSTLGQAVRVSESRLRILVACGAAGGISATFNAPIAGVFFALELILRDFEAESFGVVVLSSFVADIIGRAAFGSHPFLTLPSFQLTSPLEYPLYAGLGLVAALVGVAFIHVLYNTEDLADRIWRGPEWLRPACGGLLLGLLLLALPELYGVGYYPLEQSIHGNYVLWLLLAMLVGKILATSLTIAIGGSGGVFAPSLFMGAMLGSAYGAAMHQLLPGLAAPAGAYGLVGMGAVFAAAARAPITAVIIIFELTGDYRIILPLMFAVALATGVSKFLSRDTIYTLKLRRRGIDVMRGRSANLMRLLTVGQAMQSLPEPVRSTLPLAELVERLTDSAGSLPVVDEEGRYRGIVSAQQVEQALRENAFDVEAAQIAEQAPGLQMRQSLEEALGALLRSRAGLPVVAGEGEIPVGWLTHLDVLRAYNTRLEQGVGATGTRPPRRSEPSRDPRRPSTALARLRGYRIVDIELASNGPPVGRRLGDVAWPDRSSVLTIHRDDRTLAPRRDEQLERGDRLTILVPVTAADSLVDAISAPADES